MESLVKILTLAQGAFLVATPFFQNNDDCITNQTHKIASYVHLILGVVAVILVMFVYLGRVTITLTTLLTISIVLSVIALLASIVDYDCTVPWITVEQGLQLLVLFGFGVYLVYNSKSKKQELVYAY